MNLAKLARKSIEHFLKHKKILPGPKDLQERAGVFVSLHQKDGSLRGCIGTVRPVCNNIAEETIRNALLAAFSDPRFRPLVRQELDGIDISVDVLKKPEKIKHESEPDPQKYGLIVTAPDGREGLLLPKIEGVKTASEQKRIALAKAGIDPKEKYEVSRFSVERIHE